MLLVILSTGYFIQMIREPRIHTELSGVPVLPGALDIAFCLLRTGGFPLLWTGAFPLLGLGAFAPLGPGLPGGTARR